MDSRAREVNRIGDAEFSKKQQIDSLHQEIALNFYPERADFTTKRNEGEEFADHLFASYPILARRELGNMLAEFLRPGEFFGIHVDDEDLDEGDQERAFLEHISKIQWRGMSDPAANLVRATTQTDHDFAAFGNGVLRASLNVAGDGLLHRNYHLRDCAWSENAEGKVDAIHRNWNPTARQLKQHFRNKVSKDVIRACEKDPEKTFACRHVVLPSRVYDYKSKGGKSFPYVSLFVERETETVLEEVGMNWFEYVVPRWQTVSGSAYGVSMATMILLPDGRTLQVVMRTTREAGENYVNPPLIAVSDAIRGDIALYPGGITTADIEYDAKLGDVLRPITKDKGGFPITFDIANALKEDIRQGFMLDKIQLPETTRAMTATEVRRRVQEHIRAAAPISKPIQQDYNHPLCEIDFQIMMEAGAFPMDAMPASLEGMELKYKFRSPLDELAEQNEADIFVDVRDRILVPSAQIDPSVIETANLAEATRDAMRAAGWKQKWFKPKEAVDERREQEAEKAQLAEIMETAGAAGQVAEQGGKGIDAIMKAGQQQGAPASQPV
jgi:hypothetical protein